MEILKHSLANLQMDRNWMIRNVTEIAVAAIQAEEQGSGDSAGRLEYEISQLTKKKEDVLDAFFS